MRFTTVSPANEKKITKDSVKSYVQLYEAQVVLIDGSLQDMGNRLSFIERSTTKVMNAAVNNPC